MTAIYFAGAEVKALTDALLAGGVKHILYSFYYILTMQRESFIRKTIEANPQVKFFLDSGAFTFFSQYKDNPEKLPPPEEYVKLYFRYIEEHGHLWERIAEPDLDIGGSYSVTLRDVDRWRNQMLERWPNYPITVVWHGQRGPLEWTKYCQDPKIRHIAYGSGINDVGMVRCFLNEAQWRGKTVHGFAQTKLRLLRYAHFDSVDSTSWLSGQRFGTLYVWRGDRFVTLPSTKKNQRRLFRRYFQNIGVDPKLISEDDTHEVRKCNVISWRILSEKLQERIRQMELARRGEGIAEAVYPTPRQGVVSQLFASAPREREEGPRSMWAKERDDEEADD